MYLVVSLCAHCRFIGEYIPNVIVKNILSTVSQGSKCTRNIIASFQYPSPPVKLAYVKHIQNIPDRCNQYVLAWDIVKNVPNVPGHVTMMSQIGNCQVHFKYLIKSD